MSGRQRAGLRSWTPAPSSPFALERERPARAAGRARRGGAEPLTVAAENDAAEAHADRLGSSVAAGVPVRGDAGRAPVPGGALQRQTPPATDPAAKEKAAHDKEAEKRLGELRDAALKEAVKVEPLKSLVAQGKALLATPEGKIALAEAVLSAIATSVLLKKELPVTSWTQDLGDLHSSLTGVSATIKWEGPANDPTKASLDLKVAPETGPAAGFSATVGGQTGTTAPNQLRSGVGYAPRTGPLRGIDLGIGTSVTERPGMFPVGAVQAGVGYTVPSGIFEGTRATLNATADTAGGYGGTIGLSIPLGPKPKAPRRRTEERLERWADPAAGAAGPSAAAARGGEVASAPPSVDAVLAQPGMALPAPVRVDMEAGFGADFSRVRLHADDRAAASARDVGALAYTVGPHVVFGSGQWRPGTVRGREVLAHELAHVVQQQAAPPKGAER